MFSFVTEIMEMYYQNKLLSLANNRVETYVGIRFQGLNAHTIARQYIKATENGWYTVQSQTIRGEYYSVNTIIGFCTCPRGTNGSPRVHQAAVVRSSVESMASTSLAVHHLLQGKHLLK